MIKTFLYGEDDSLPLLLKSLLKLRHGQITFQGAWNGTVGEVSDLHAVIEVHNPLLMDLILKMVFWEQQKATSVVTGAASTLSS